MHGAASADIESTKLALHHFTLPAGSDDCDMRQYSGTHSFLHSVRSVARARSSYSRETAALQSTSPGRKEPLNGGVGTSHLVLSSVSGQEHAKPKVFRYEAFTLSSFLFSYTVRVGVAWRSAGLSWSSTGKGQRTCSRGTKTSVFSPPRNRFVVAVR